MNYKKMTTLRETIAYFEKQQKRYMREHDGEECPHYNNAIIGLKELEVTRRFVTDRDLIYELSCYAKGTKPDYMDEI